MNTNFLKKISLHLSVFSLMNLCLQPLAIAAESKTQQQNLLLSKMKRFVEITEIHKREITVGELIQKLNKNSTPEQLKNNQKFFEGYEKFKDIKLPKVQPVVVKDKAGREILRLNTTVLGKTYSIDFNDSSQNPVTINGTKIAYSDASEASPLLQKLMKMDSRLGRGPASTGAQTSPRFVLTGADYLKLNAVEKMNYLIQLRSSMLQLEKYQNAFSNKTTASNPSQSVLEYVFHSFFIEKVLANNIRVGDTCVIAGNISKYATAGSKTSCGLNDPDLIKQNKLMGCNASSVACNPLVYGNDVCVSPSKTGANDHTAVCNAKVPISAQDNKGDDKVWKLNKEKIVKDSVGDLNKQENLDKHFDELNKALSEASKVCEKFDKGPDDQIQACNNLKHRLFQLKLANCSIHTDQAGSCDAKNPTTECKAQCQNVGKYCPDPVPGSLPDKGKTCVSTCKEIVKQDPPVKPEDLQKEAACDKQGGKLVDGKCMCAQVEMKPNQDCRDGGDGNVSKPPVVDARDRSSGSGDVVTSGSSSKEKGFFAKMADWNWTAISIGALVVGGIALAWNNCLFMGNNCQDADIKNGDLDSGRGTERNPTYPTTPFRPGITF